MKNIKFIIVFLILTSALISCQNDGGSSAIDLATGAVPNINKSTNFDGFIDFQKVENGTPIQIGVNIAIAEGDVSSADVIGFYKTSTNTFGPAILKSGITDFPFEMTLSTTDIVSAFTELTSSDDMSLGDALIITTNLTLNNGQVLKILNDDLSNNYGSDVSSSSVYTVKVSYPVSCPSDLGGTYSVISNGDNTDGQPAAVNVPYTVTLTDNGGGNYTISDFSAGVYLYWYTIYGLTWEQPSDINDICGSLSGTFGDAWAQEIPATGTVNNDGTLTISWQNPWGDYATSVYTPQ